MGYCDGKWTPVIIMITINSALGLGNALVKKVLDGGVNHMVIATYRLAISTLFLAPIAFFWERTTRPKLTLNILVQLFFSALVGVEKLNMKSKAGMWMVMGTLICIGGALLLTMYKGVPLTKFHKLESHLLTNHNPALKPENWIVGCVLLFAGSSCFGSWMLIQSKVNDKYPCQYSSTVILSFFGTIQCALLSLIKSRDITAWILTDKLDIMTIIYAGAVAQGICTVGTSWCIRKRGPIFTSVFTPVGLVFATLFDFSILLRQICIGSVIGSGIVIFGLYIFLLGKVRQMKEECEKKLPSHFGQEESQDDEHYKKGHLMVVPMTP
ncbi:PREDICTED: WAT1-related protein At4g01440 isoform X2 [Brassica oleracea var. oleracea]|uniref:WAT1-related protein At4g01440 isoform X2 n=1 Tax=Brassica oleracea var. oleracea TaxID=109376 RepID=UPI0006A74354|nr:PREDICTED: WAT1-related protein At4g01440 isoform X2 [Brassica oleracea var. oleracea]